MFKSITFSLIMLLLAVQLMFPFGRGRCSETYYMGWDGQGTANEDACKSVCMSEHQCTFAEYLDDGAHQSCNRHSSATCHLLASSHYELSHYTFIKKGLLDFQYFN